MAADDRTQQLIDQILGLPKQESAAGNEKRRACAGCSRRDAAAAWFFHDGQECKVPACDGCIQRLRRLQIPVERSLEALRRKIQKRSRASWESRLFLPSDTEVLRWEMQDRLLELERKQGHEKKRHSKAGPRKRFIASLKLQTPGISQKKLCGLLDSALDHKPVYAPPVSWKKRTWADAYADRVTRPKVQRLLSKVKPARLS